MRRYRVQVTCPNIPRADHVQHALVPTLLAHDIDHLRCRRTENLELCAQMSTYEHTHGNIGRGNTEMLTSIKQTLDKPPLHIHT